MTFTLSGWRPGTSGDGNDECQLYAITPSDGQPDENASDNCGFACVSMILYWSQNILVSPDDIKDAVLGQGTTGYSYVGQLSDYLNTRDIPTQWVHETDAATALAQCRAWVQQDNPVIVLTYSNWATKAGGHFVLCIGTTDDGGVQVSNPWTGGEETWTPAMWAQAYNAYLIRAECGPYQAGPYNSPTDGPTPQPAPAPTPTIGTNLVRRYVVAVDMEARSTPELRADGSNVIWQGTQPQMVHREATLQGTGRWTPSWRECRVGSPAKPVWLLAKNLRIA